MTPPFGFALFYVKGILPPSIKIQEVYRGVIPFIIIICIVTALCAVFLLKRSLGCPACWQA